MKRTTLLAALTGATVLLAGCGSTSGTATPTSSSTSGPATSSSSSSTAAPTSSASSSMAPVTSASPSEAPVSSATSSETASSSAVSSTSSSETASSSASPSEDTSTSKSAPPTTTVGNNTEALDAKTTAWFNAFCTGVEPVVTGAKELTKMSSSSSAAEQKQTTKLFETLGSSLTKTAATLKGLPAPTFQGGSAFASKVVTAFGSSGPALSAAAKKIAASPSSPSAAAMSDLTQSLQKAVAPIQDLGSLKLTPATQAGIQKLPACAAVQKAATS